MKHNLFSRFLSIALVLVMVASVVPASILADDELTADSSSVVSEIVESVLPEETPAAQEPAEQEPAPVAEQTPAPTPAADETAPLTEEGDQAAAPTPEVTPEATPEATPAAGEEDPENDEQGSAPELIEQTIQAVVYEDADCLMLADSDEPVDVITLTGNMPEGAEAKAYPVQVEIEGEVVLAAYDITIYDAQGNVYQPQDGAIQVKIETPQIAQALQQESELSVYHMEDETAEPEKVEEVAAVETAVEFAAESFSIYVVTDPTQHFTHTYIFMVNGEEASRQILSEGETLLEPETPRLDGYVFKGWLLPDGSTFAGFNQVEGALAENKTTTLTADLTQGYYVFYKDGLNGRVIHTQIYAPNSKVDWSDVPYTAPGEDEALIGWSQNHEATQPEENVTVTNSDVILYPVVAKAHWITYYSQGGSVVEPTYVLAGQAAVEPAEPTRPGYTFAGWYTDAEGGTKYNFDSVVTEDITLYAHWTPGRVSYTVVHWWENANDEEYSYHDSETLTGTTGELTKAQAKSYPIQDKNIYGQNVTRYPFTAQEIEQQTIAGDGSTIVNVYYTRAEYTLTFEGMQVLTCTKEEHEHKPDYSKLTWDGLKYYGGCYPENGANWGQVICGKEEHTHRRGCYSEQDFTITAKYQERITNWPTNNGSSNWILTQGGWGETKYLANLSNMPLDDGKLYADNSEGDLVTVPYYVEALSPDSVGADGKKAIYVGGQYFVLHHNDVTRGTYSYDVGNEDRYEIFGFTCNTQLSSQNGATYGKAKFYYNRNSYNIVYYNGGDIDHKQAYRYEADISGAGNYTPTRPAGIPDDYTFAGWYKDPQGMEKYDFNGKTMPANDLILYAKWAPVVYTVSFDLAGGQAPEGSSEDAYKPQENILPGYTATKPVDPVREGYTFAGWYTKDGQPFSFTTPIGKNYELVARWVGNEAHTVTYDPGYGNGVAFEDPNKYAANAKAKVLEVPEDWTAQEGKEYFVCWNTKEDGTGDSYYPGETFQMPNEDITLYAQWSAKRETVLIYDHNYENGPEDKIVKIDVPNSEYEIDYEPERDGYDFLGWSKSPEPAEGETLLQVGDIIQVDTLKEETNILYAQWQAANGDLTVTKTLDKLNPMKGDNASFAFEIKNNTTGVTYYHVFTFNVGGSQSFTFNDLPAGTYTVKELDAGGYTVDGNEKQVSVPAGGEGSIGFANTASGNTPGDNDYANNQFAYTDGEWVWNRNDDDAVDPQN